MMSLLTFNMMKNYIKILFMGSWKAPAHTHNMYSIVEQAAKMYECIADL